MPPFLLALTPRREMTTAQFSTVLMRLYSLSALIVPMPPEKDKYEGATFLPERQTYFISRCHTTFTIYLISCMHLFCVNIPYISDCIIDKFPNCFLGPKSGYLEQVLLQRSLHKCLFSKHPRYRQDQCYTCRVFQGFGLFVQFPLRFNNNKPNPLSALSSCEH